MLGLLGPFLGPLVLVEAPGLVVARAKAIDLGLFGIGRLAGLGVDAPVARGGAPVDLQHRVGPLPAGREFVRSGGELRHGEFVERFRIFQPHAVLVLVGEEVAEHGAARCS